MTRAQYEREKLRLAREKELRILAEAQRNADPDYVLTATGFWLKRWQGKRRATKGRRTSCPATSLPPTNSTSPSAENSGCSLSI